MADHIPFVFSTEDLRLLGSFYSDSIAVRLSLKNIHKTAVSSIPPNSLMWLDPAVDGLDRWPNVDHEYERHISKFNGHDRIGDATFQQSPQEGIVKEFVDAVLDKCNTQLGVNWLSIPQLPLVNDSSRNKINKCLAKCTRQWKLEEEFKGKLILPIIFTNQKQLNLKTERNKKISLIEQCFELSGADGIWAVDSSLSDQDSSPKNEQRFSKLMSFHQELGVVLPKDAISIAGPYWGMNLILWARGLVRYPAVGLGSSYQYYIPANSPKKAKVRLAIPPIKRCAVAGPQLRKWLEGALIRLPKEDEAHRELAELLRHFDRFEVRNRSQIASFYKKWFEKIATAPDSSRALALYQDLSSAYVIGKSLQDLPSIERAGRKPYRVAKHLMVNCL